MCILTQTCVHEDNRRMIRSQFIYDSHPFFLKESTLKLKEQFKIPHLFQKRLKTQKQMNGIILYTPTKSS